MFGTPPKSLLAKYSGELYRIRHHKCLSVSNQVSSFFKYLYFTLPPALTKSILEIKTLAKVVTSLNRPHIYLSYFYFNTKKFI